MGTQDNAIYVPKKMMIQLIIASVVINVLFLLLGMIIGRDDGRFVPQEPLDESADHAESSEPADSIEMEMSIFEREQESDRPDPIDVTYLNTQQETPSKPATETSSASKPSQRVQEEPSLTDESKFRDPQPNLPSSTSQATIGHADGSYVIQVVASKERAKVEKMRQKLAAQGYRAYLEPQGEFTRLIVGFFPRESDAVTEKKRIDKVLRSDRVNCWVRKR